MTFNHTLSKVSNRGNPPASFIRELVEWGKSAPAEIFAPNPNPADVYSMARWALGPYVNNAHRRAVMLEVMRVHAGFESSWNWKEGVDTTNKTSMANIEGQETGAWQVSFNSTWLNAFAMRQFAKDHNINTPKSFIDAMKVNHVLAMEYYARLVRVSIQWAGPLKRSEVLPWLRRDSVEEFIDLLS